MTRIPSLAEQLGEHRVLRWRVSKEGREQMGERKFRDLQCGRSIQCGGRGGGGKRESPGMVIQVLTYEGQ